MEELRGDKTMTEDKYKRKANDQGKRVLCCRPMIFKKIK